MGTGGVGNLIVTNWMRDKGYGMGKLTGAIPSAIRSREIGSRTTERSFRRTPGE